jgi:hypothetical protein
MDSMLRQCASDASPTVFRIIGEGSDHLHHHTPRRGGVDRLGQAPKSGLGEQRNTKPA